MTLILNVKFIHILKQNNFYVIKIIIFLKDRNSDKGTDAKSFKLQEIL